MTPERLRPHLEAWIEHGGLGRVHVVHLDGPWSGAEQLLVGDQYVDVRVCPSELAVREELTHPRPSGRTTVLLCPVELRGADLLARIAKRRVLRLHAWDAVPHLFGVRQIDPILLKEKWMAEALVEAAPSAVTNAAPRRLWMPIVRGGRCCVIATASTQTVAWAR